MKKKLLIFMFLVACPSVFAQNIGVNSTGSAPDAGNFFEVKTPASFTTNNSAAGYFLHTGTPTTGYGLWGIKTGASTTNIAARFSAKGGTNNYALVVPTDSGWVGFGTLSPSTLFHIDGGTVSTTQTIATITGNSLSTGKGLSITSSSLTTGQLLNIQSTSTGANINHAINAENSSSEGFSIRAWNKSATAPSGADYSGRVAAIYAKQDASNAIGVFADASNAGAQSIGIWGAGSGNSNSIGIFGIGNAQGYAALSTGAGGYFIGSTYGSYNVSNSTSNGTNWGGASSNAAVYGKAGSGTTEYSAGIYGYQVGSGNNSGGVIGAYDDSRWGGLGYSDGSGTRWGMFTPSNIKAQGYLLVGNPSSPQSVSSYSLTIWRGSMSDPVSTFYSENVCSGDNWSFVASTDGGGYYTTGYALWNNLGSRARANMYTDWIWVPTGATNVTLSLRHFCDAESGYDGVFMQYSTDGSTWTKITSWSSGDYNSASVDGSNTACSADDLQSGWTGGLGDVASTSNAIAGIAGKWVRFRWVGMEDELTSTGSYRLYDISLDCTLPVYGGAFASGNIYAEKNVYAGSNVLIGDVAEYFNVDAQTEPGDLIAMKHSSGNEYTVSDSAYSSFIIGIHSAAPTVTLNQPSGTPVSLTGRVYVKVNAENGKIKIGDYLTSASLKGCAMKAAKSCFIIGRALENFEENGTGKILCMVETGWYNPSGNNNQSGGSFSLKINNAAVIVNDPSVKLESRIFVTFRDNPSAYYWINNVKHGSFILNIDKPANKELPFDYFVDNALHNSSKEELTQSDVEQQVQKKEGRPFSKYNTEIPPSIPSDQEQVWIWSEEKGFKMTKDISSLSK